MAANYRGRFAPSPTGPLHFGSLVAALASYCDARAHGGEWLVRIEDVDLPRARPGASDAILATLRRYGFAWDHAVTWQSKRNELYEQAFDRLNKERLMFPCVCTRKELEAATFGPVGERVYPGTCRGAVTPERRPQARDEGHCAWRVKVDDRPIAFVDRLQGPQEQRLATDVGDYVVKRSDGLFAYQLAVVVDDAEQGITHVVRGADLLTSTPRQIWLQQLLGLTTPVYMHHPIALDTGGAKLSKESGAAKLPNDPCPALLLAWAFLDQQRPPTPPASVDEFWHWAFDQWNPQRLPPVTALPVPVLLR